jgi:FG-GAP-like repeat
MKEVVRKVAGMLFALQAAMAQAQYSAEFIEDSKAWGSVVADFNGDGHDDIFITGHDTDDRIWYWTPNGYVPSPQTLVWVDRHDCDAADFNRDGRMDFYCAVGAHKGFGTGPKELWLQDEAGRFAQLADHGAEDIYGSGRIPVFLDFNHDGYPDLYLTNQRVVRLDGHLSINRLFINQAGTRFTELTTVATGGRGWGCATKGDVNGDGWDDLLVCDLEGPPHIYLNNRAGDFTELASPAAAAKWLTAKLADMNSDGRDDLVLLGDGNRLQIWLNTGVAPYFVTPAYVNRFGMLAKSLTVGDFNRDGRMDVYVVMMKSGCPQTLDDVADDLVFQGLDNGSWGQVALNQGYAGCGHLADTVDGSRVLLMNGGIGWRGPNYVLSWQP